MKTYAPKYYASFKCIADRCRRNCCIGWDIGIDDDTADYYSTVGGDLGKKLSEAVVCDDGEYSFRMCEGGRCPFLLQSGLCELICNLGEEALSDICREHPRFYNYLCGREEVGLGLSCEAAAELILFGKYNSRPELLCEDDDVASRVSDFDPTEKRNLLLDLFEKNAPAQSLIEKMMNTFSLSRIPSASERIDTLLSLPAMDKEYPEILRRAKEKLSAPKTDFCALNDQYRRLCSYLVYRHVSAAENDEDLRKTVGFAAFVAMTFIDLCESEKLSPHTDRDRVVYLASMLSSEIEYSPDNTEVIKSLFV